MVGDTERTLRHTQDVADTDPHCAHTASAGEEAMGASPSVRPASGMDGCSVSEMEDVAGVDLHCAYTPSAGEEAMGASPSVRPASGMDGCSVADVRVCDTAA